MTSDPKTPDPRLAADPELDRAWRALSREEPPAELDAAIRAAARRAVSTRPQRLRESLRPERWWWPLAAAATIGAVTIGILQLGEPERREAARGEGAVVSDMPAPQSPAAQTPAPPLAKPQGDEMRDRNAAPESTPAPPAPPQRAVRSRQAPDDTGRMERAAKDSAPVAQPPAPAPVPPSSGAARLGEPFPAGAASATAPAPSAAGPLAEPFPAGAPSPPKREDAAREPAMSGKLAAEEIPQSAPVPAPTAPNSAASQSAPPPALAKPAPASVGKTTAGAGAHAPLPIPDWIALIRRLRAEGRTDEAARELAAFRAAHADHARLLPEDLRDWRPVEPPAGAPAR